MSQDPFAGFAPEVQEAVEGLLWLGHIEEEFEFCGHTFVLRTLRGDEDLAAAKVSKEYLETFGQLAGMAWATVALALVSVDGDEAFCPPIGPDKEAFARARFKYCTSRWYWPLAEYLFASYEGLRKKQTDAIQAVQDLSHRGPQTFSPSADSSNEQGDSEIPPEILALMQED